MEPQVDFGQFGMPMGKGLKLVPVTKTICDKYKYDTIWAR